MSEASEHLVKSYDNDLRRLRGLIVEMGGLVERQFAVAVQAIAERDTALANGAIASDPAIDALEREIEQFVVRLLALRQPMANDLRQVVAALKMTGDLERMGDYAANVAKRCIALTQFTLTYPMTGLYHMGQLVQAQIKLVIDAAGSDDADKALQVWRSDAAIDDIYNTLFRELITYMMEDPRNITPCTHLLFVAKNIERVGDHATNIAETIHYAVTGAALPDDRPKSDRSAYAVVRPPGD